MKPGALLLMPGFGGGLSYCAHVVRWGERVTPLRDILSRAAAERPHGTGADPRRDDAQDEARRRRGVPSLTGEAYFFAAAFFFLWRVLRTRFAERTLVDLAPAGLRIALAHD